MLLYQAELGGKIPHALSRMEDVLTSNVFSFFKYAERTTFLRRYLRGLGFPVTREEATKAEFFFWPRFDDNTEPDVVVIAGAHYLVVEAKYGSDFGAETDTSKLQIIREVDQGLLEAQNLGKRFTLLAVTADHIYPSHKFLHLSDHYLKYIVWTNWQGVAQFLDEMLCERSLLDHERAFARDLHDLLDKHNLRNYHGTDSLYRFLPNLSAHRKIFFDDRTASLRGDFAGFPEGLCAARNKLKSVRETIFFTGGTTRDDHAR